MPMRLTQHDPNTRNRGYRIHHRCDHLGTDVLMWEALMYVGIGIIIGAVALAALFYFTIGRVIGEVLNEVVNTSSEIIRRW